LSAEILASTEQKMGRALEAMERDFEGFRTGRASASLVERLPVEGGQRLGQLASISIPDPRQIVVQPWDRHVLSAIAKAITQSGIGIRPTVDGSAVRLYFPALTEDRRRELVGLIHRRMEQARVEVRVLRHEATAALRAGERRQDLGADEAHRESELLQRMTDRFGAEIDRLGQVKVEHILDRSR
jgi:ribosome recycling factor